MEGNRSDEEGEEGRIHSKLRTVPKVCKEERDLHELIHCRYRSWCKYCVEGRSHKMGHRIRKPEEKEADAVPRVSMDYFYMSQRDEEAKEKPMLVVLNEESHEKFERMTGRKGAGEAEEGDWLIKELSRTPVGMVAGLSSKSTYRCSSDVQERCC